jgi:hypothetical protein
VAEIFHLFGLFFLAPPAWLLFNGKVLIFNEEATQATEAVATGRNDVCGGTIVRDSGWLP